MTGKKLDLENPRTYNEKIQWLKLYDRRPEYTMMADKYEVRNFIKAKIGEGYLIPMIGLYNTVDEIDFEELPDKFVIKCTHDSGSVVVCTDKSKLEIDSVKRHLQKYLSRNYFLVGREWVYKNISPRIICEEYLVDDSGKELKDYKVFCFDGEPKVIQVDFDRFVDHKRNIYDTKWNLLDVEIHFPKNSSKVIPRPSQLEEMLEVAHKLSENIPHLRVDMYLSRGKIYFGELTFTHGSGFETFRPQSFDNLLGSWIKLPI